MTDNGHTDADLSLHASFSETRFAERMTKEERERLSIKRAEEYLKTPARTGDERPADRNEETPGARE